MRLRKLFVPVVIAVVIIAVLTAGCVSSDEKFLEGKAFIEAGDYASGIPVLEDAANGGNITAMYWLGCIFDSQSYNYYYPEQALNWYNKAAEGNYGDAYAALGEIYLNGYCEVKKDVGKAIEYFQKAVELNSPEGMYYLAQCYSEGNGVSKDLKKAFELYSKGAELGNIKSMASLAHAYRLGEGTEIDMDKHYEWAKKAADGDLGRGYFELGIAYEDTFYDLETAYKYYEKAYWLKGYRYAEGAYKRLAKVLGKTPLYRTVDWLYVYNPLYDSGDHGTPANAYWEWERWGTTSDLMWDDYYISLANPADFE